jgi:UDP:flavonoid glycosyltransferase YjiC (YdhE family)
MRARAPERRIGCCITGHGFGHATRSIAVLQALEARIPISVDILTTVPSWLFAQSLNAPHTVHQVLTDVGLVQKSAFDENLPATLEALDAFYPLSDKRIQQAADLLKGCSLVLCDIAPLGIAAARTLDIPSVLVENFTWDWIYEGYQTQWPQLQRSIDYLAQLFQQAAHHIQASPVCRTRVCDLVVNPVARALRNPKLIREAFGVAPDQKLILLTMGGIGGEEVAIPPLLQHPDLVFVLSGRSGTKERYRNLRFLRPDSLVYHPDLVAAADLVVAKIGYSTVAEAYQAGTPFAYVARSGFRESEPLAAFVDKQMFSWKITRKDLEHGGWLDALPSLPVSVHGVRTSPQGAGQVADYLAGLLTHTSSCRPSK